LIAHADVARLGFARYIGRMRNLSILFVTLSVAALVAACGGDDSETNGDGGTTSGQTTSTTTGTGGSGGQGGGTTTSTTGQGGGGAGQGGATTTTTGAGGQGGQGGQGGAQGWVTPACGPILGTGAVTYTLDEGATLTPTAEALQGIGYTYGLVALDVPNTLLAEHQGQILRSTDAGCSWTGIGPVAAPLTLVAAPGGRAYAFQDNSTPLYRIDGTTITKLTLPGNEVLGLGVDPADGSHLRVGDGTGALWDSTDAGDTWLPVGVAAPANGMVYRHSFDPNSIDHILVGTAVNGSFVSTDGGGTWVKSTGLAAGNVNVFSIVVSPADGNVVWAQGIDLEKTSEPVASGRRIWRSTDGGVTFTEVVKQTAQITIRNQELLAPHPVDTNVLYFVFGTYFQGYGTDIYKYDQTTGMVTITHNQYNDVNAVAFSPANPSVMYLGLTSDAVN
jgi:hypothetical protein